MFVLCTNNQVSEKEIKKMILFITAPKRTKHLGISLTKMVKDSFTKSCKKLMKVINEDTV